MSRNQTAGLLVLLITTFNSMDKGHSIPTTRPRVCSPPEPLVFNHGNTLQLECGSYCSSPTIDDSSLQYRWSKKVMVGDNVLDMGFTTGPLYTLDRVMFRDGGEYRCSCVDGGQECLYNVSIIPVMTFEASDKFVHRGDTFDLSCTLSGFPLNFSRILSKQSGEVMPNQMQKRVNESTTRSYVPVFNPEGNVYVCEAESYFTGQLVAQFRKEVIVDVYDPPSIIYTTEYIISSVEDFGKSGQLVCTIQQSPDITSYVTWFNKGTEVSNDTKYTSFTLPTEEEDILRYKLVVSDLQESDIGSYLCRLSSPYGVEDVQEAWIQVDFRKNSDAISEHGETHAHGSKNKGFAGPTSGQSNILFFAFCGLFILAAMVALWRISQGQRLIHRRGYKSSPSSKQYLHESSDKAPPSQPLDEGRYARKHC